MTKLKPIDWTKPLTHYKGSAAVYVGPQEKDREGRPILSAFKHLCLVGNGFNYYDEFGRVKGEEQGKDFRRFLHGKFDGATKDAEKINATLLTIKEEISAGFLLLAGILEGKKPEAPTTTPAPEPKAAQKPVAVVRSLDQLASVKHAEIARHELFSREPAYDTLKTIAYCSGIKRMAVSDMHTPTNQVYKATGAIKFVSEIVGGFKIKAYGSSVCRDVYIYVEKGAEKSVRAVIREYEPQAKGGH